MSRETVIELIKNKNNCNEEITLNEETVYLILL